MKQYEKRFCPDVDSNGDQLEIKNIYDNENERISFSLEIYRCKLKKCQPTG